MKKAFDVVFKDEYLVIINKIARILAQPTPKKEKRTLAQLVQEGLGRKVFLCHRLDRDTQGLMILANSLQIQKEIFSQFKRQEIEKKYLALVEGNFKKKKGVFRSLVLDKEGKKFNEKPKKAVTAYKVIKSCKGFDFLEITPKTGRTNQIRIHLSQAGHPILGEKKYAFRRDFVIKFNRLALYAYYLAFRHPVSQDKITIKLNIPEYMQNFIKRGG